MYDYSAVMCHCNTACNVMYYYIVKLLFFFFFSSYIIYIYVVFKNYYNNKGFILLLSSDNVAFAATSISYLFVLVEGVEVQDFGVRVYSSFQAVDRR